jgi:predicted N-formylglutamate amidohydrolase
MATHDAFIVTCEHGGNAIPPRYRRLFRRAGPRLATHRGYDLGAMVIGRTLARGLHAPLLAATVSRLLVDLNRSVGHPHHFSALTRALPADARARIVERYWRPHRDRVEACVERCVARGRRVVHIASHTFTPRLDGEVRRADVALLYDPRRAGEVALCARWKAALATLDPTLRVRRNYPYAGKADGLTAHLRKRYSPNAYVGVELEVNQGIVVAGGRRWAALRRALVESLRMAAAR